MQTLSLQQLIVLRVKTTHAHATADWHCNNKQSTFSTIEVYKIGIVRQWKSPLKSGSKVSACRTQHRNNRNPRVAPAALQIRATLTEDPGLFKLPPQGVPPMIHDNAIALSKTTCFQQSEKTKPNA